MNKKVILIILIIVIGLVGIIILKNNKSKKIERNEIITTKEEATKRSIEKVKEKLEKAGLVLKDKKEETMRLSSDIKGCSYYISKEENSVLNNGNRIEIYMLTPKNRKEIFNDINVEDGEVQFWIENADVRGLLYGNILILNCNDNEIRDEIAAILE